jgi:hypothetical protein
MTIIRAIDLPAFKAWSNKFEPPMRASGYLEHETTTLSAMFVVELVFPSLIEVRGCVLRADKYNEPNFNGWWQALGGDPEQVERIINFFPTRGYFQPADDVEERALEVLADRIALGWRTTAAIQFPDRPIVAEVIEGTEDDGPTVILYTKRAGRADSQSN